MAYTAKTLISYLFLPIGLSCSLHRRHSPCWTVPSDSRNVRDARSNDGKILERSRPSFIPEGKQNIYVSLFLVIGPGRTQSVLWQVTGWMIRVLKPAKGKIFFSTATHPPSFLFHGYRLLFQRYRNRDVKLTTYLHLVPTLRKGWTLLALLYVFKDVNQGSFDCTSCF